MTPTADQREYWPTQEWRNIDPVSVGMDGTKFSDLDRIIKAQYSNINGIAIIRKGYLVFEQYYHDYGPQDTHNVASVTKSVISALIGIAIDAGYIKSVNEKILSFFPEYSPEANDITKRTITIKHILTMTAPFPWKVTERRAAEPLDRLRRQKDWVQYALDQLGRGGPVGQFQYSTTGTHLLSAILSRTTGKSAREFANERLFRPLGMHEIPDHEMKSFLLDEVFGKNAYGWVKDPQGYTTGGWGLNITLRDMARFGFLYLNRGIWEKNQIISEKWITESLTPSSIDYGYLWWLRNENKLFSYSALGSGGNVICCIPGKDIVIVIGSKIIAKPKDRWSLIEEYIIPALNE